MPTVNDVLRLKCKSVISVPATASVLDAVKTMNDHHIGAVLVMDQEELAGIFTERDILRRVVASERHPRDLKIREVMTTGVVCCGPFTDLDDIAVAMRSRRIRHVPVKDASDAIIGVISIGDINAFNVRHKQETIDSMTDYICGRS